MASINDKRVKVARQVRRLIQKRQDDDNRLRDWEEIGEAYIEAYRRPIEKAAGFTDTQFLVRARGWLARELNRYVGNSLNNLRKGKTKNSPFNPVYRVNGGLMDIVHAVKKADTPEKMRTVANVLEHKLSDVEASAASANQKVAWIKGVTNYAREKAGLPRLEAPEMQALPSPEEVDAAVAEAIERSEEPEELVADEPDEDEIAGDEVDIEDDDDE